MTHTPRAFNRMGFVACAALLAACALGSGCDMDSGRAGALGSGGTAAAPAAKAAEGADKPYSILLRMFTEPERHIQDAEYYRQTLTNNLKWKGVFVINKAGRSELFWGRYASPAAAQADLRIAKAHRTQTGEQPFPMAFVVPLPGADIGPAAWNLRNTKGRHTLLVATFQDDATRRYIGRKQFALDYCKRLRDGGYEAYFYHGPVISMVTIGVFGAGAVSHQSGGDAIVDSYTVTEPKVAALQRDFPYLAINGNTESQVVRGTTGSHVEPPEKTVLILIPREEAEANDLGGAHAPAAAKGRTAAPNTPPAPPATPGPAPAKYRSEALP